MKNKYYKEIVKIKDNISEDAKDYWGYCFDIKNKKKLWSIKTK